MNQVNAIKKEMYHEVISAWRGTAYAVEHTFSQPLPAADAEVVRNYIYEMLKLGDPSTVWISSFTDGEFASVAFVFDEAAPLTVNIPLSA